MPPLDHLLTQDATLVGRSEGATDPYGQPSQTWADIGTVKTFMQPTNAQERQVGSDTQIATFKAFMPPDTPIDGLDRIRVDGTTYNILGPPLPHRTPRGVHHLQLMLEVVDG